MTPKQIELARHALGLTGGRSVSYRNHFVIGEGGDDHAEWMAMTAGGDAVRREKVAIYAGDDCFYLTRRGAEAALRPGEDLNPSDVFPVGRIA